MFNRETLLKLSEQERNKKIKTMKKLNLNAQTAEYLRSKGFGKYICPDDTITLYPEEINELGL